MLYPPHFNGSDTIIRPYEPGDEASMYTVSATIEAANAGDLLAWTIQLEETLKAGGAAWVAARGRRVRGYAIILPVPGLPSVFELTGGVASPWQHRGIGTRLLDAVKRESSPLGARHLSCMVPDVTGPTSGFLLNRGFYVEHEECLLELDIAHELPPSPDMPELSLQTFPRAQTVTLFPAVYKQSFGRTSWAQPYSETETDALLAQPEDILYLMRDDEVIGVAWIETMSNGHGRIEPFGIVEPFQYRGYGRWLLRAALEELQRRGVQTASLGLWRDNTAAQNLYRRAGFAEVSNWYYLACDLPE